MKWKHIQNIDKNGKFAEMFLYDEVSDTKVNGMVFAHEMRYLRMYEGVSIIKVKINSPGGDVMHGKSIIAEIIDSEENGVCVQTIGNGLMASIAGVIWLTAKPENRFCKDYARLMLHGVSPKEQGDLNDDDYAALDNFKKSLVQICASRTGKKESYFEALFTNGQDNWFDVKAMLKTGLVLKDNVENTDIKADIQHTAGVRVVYNQLTEINNNINKNNPTMKKVLARLGLSEGVSEDVTEQAVIGIQNKLTETSTALDAANAKVLEANNKLTEANNKLEAVNKAAAETYVKQLVKDGLIDPTKEAEALIQANNNLEGFKTAFSFMPVKANNILNVINKENPANEGDEKEYTG